MFACWWAMGFFFSAKKKSLPWLKKKRRFENTAVDAYRSVVSCTAPLILWDKEAFSGPLVRERSDCVT